MIKKIFVKMRSDEKEWKVVGNGKVLCHLRKIFQQICIDNSLCEAIIIMGYKIE